MYIGSYMCVLCRVAAFDRDWVQTLGHGQCIGRAVTYVPKFNVNPDRLATTSVGAIRSERRGPELITFIQDLQPIGPRGFEDRDQAEMPALACHHGDLVPYDRHPAGDSSDPISPR